MHFMVVKKSKKRSGFMIYSYFKDSVSQQLKGIQISYSGGEPLSEKWYIKGLGVRPRGGASPDKNLLSTTRGDLELYESTQYKKKFAGFPYNIVKFSA